MSPPAFLFHPEFAILRGETGKPIGAAGALLLSYLSATLPPDGENLTHSQITEATGLTRAETRTAIKTLSEIGMICLHVGGFPRRQSYQVNRQAIQRIIGIPAAPTLTVDEAKPLPAPVIPDAPAELVLTLDPGTEPEDHGFAEFWQAYPKKAGKIDAQKAYTKLRPNRAVRAAMLEALKRENWPEHWHKGMIKNPQGWISGGHWMNERERRASGMDVANDLADQIQRLF